MKMKRPTTDGVLRLIPAMVFACAVVGKTLAFDEFQTFLRGWLSLAPESARLLGIVTLGLELAIVVLLASPRRHRAGLALAALVSLGFLGVTLALQIAGKQTSCPCFGALPSIPLPAMSMLDLGLLVLCSAAFLRGLPAAPGPSSASDDSRPRPALPLGNRVVWGAMAVTACLLVGALAIGTHLRQKAIERRAASAHPGPLFGQPAPAFELTRPDGALLTAETLAGRWAVLCLVRPGCVPCEQQARALDAAVASWGERVKVVLVFKGGSRPSQVAAETAGLNHLREFTIVVDDDRTVERGYGDFPMRWPTTVLLDPQSRVRYAQVGHLSGEATVESEFAPWLNAAARPTIAARTADAQPAVPSFSVPLYGRVTNLRELSQERPVLLSFMLTDCEPCAARRELLDRAAPLLAEAWDLRVYASPGAHQGQGPAPYRRVALVDPASELAKAFAVTTVPISFVLYRGRIVQSLGPETSDAAFAHLTGELGESGADPLRTAGLAATDRAPLPNALDASRQRQEGRR